MLITHSLFSLTLFIEQLYKHNGVERSQTLKTRNCRHKKLVVLKTGGDCLCLLQLKAQQGHKYEIAIKFSAMK